MASSHIQTGARVDVVVPEGDTLDLTLALSRQGEPVDANQLTLVGAVWNATGTQVATLVAGANQDGHATLTGADNLDAGSYRWTLRDTGADATVAHGGYWVTETTTSA